jgi:hypothetical protein
MSDPEMTRSITTLGAVELGFALGQAAEWVKSWRKAKKQKKTVRRLIELETKNNLSHIQQFWKVVLERKEDWNAEDGEFLYGLLADQASRVPFPPLTTDAWQANLGEVASAYTESELEAMWKLQRDLKRIQSLHSVFCDAQSERQDSSRMLGYSAMGAIISGSEFAEAVREPAKELKALTESVLAFDVVNA